MKKIVLAWLVGALMLASQTAAKTLQGQVVKVSDGDTIWVQLDNGNRIKVRVWGIDTPEKFLSQKLYRNAQTCNVSINEEVYLGKLASKKAREILDHHRITLKIHGRGYYGRILGTVLINGKIDFGLVMVRSGYACVYQQNTSPKYRKAQAKARRKKRGLWKVNFPLMNCLCQ